MLRKSQSLHLFSFKAAVGLAKGKEATVNVKMPAQASFNRPRAAGHHGNASSINWATLKSEDKALVDQVLANMLQTTMAIMLCYVAWTQA